MFTGIIKELGKVCRFGKMGSIYRLDIESIDISKNVDMGNSVSVNGVCLTVVEKKKNVLSFDISEETVRKASLSSLKKGDLVNLEDSLKAGDALGGHFVLGHIDCVGKIRNIEKRAEDISMEIEIPMEFINLVVEKGSIALDGTSLTVGEIEDNRFKIHLIPHTLKATTLGSKKRGDELNVEFDIIGKYIARFKELEKAPKITEEFLKGKGF